MNKKKERKSVQQLVGMDSFTRYGVKGNYGEMLYFAVSPTNIAVLSKTTIEYKIRSLTVALSAISHIEICAFDAYENFDENKAYMQRRIAEEPNEKIRDLLQKEIAFVENVQLEMSASRQYTFILRFKRKETDEQIFQTYLRVQKILADQGFQLKKMEKDDLKRLLANYFDASYQGDMIEDIDGASMQGAIYGKVVQV